jgi:hypothetical protein
MRALVVSLLLAGSAAADTSGPAPLPSVEDGDVITRWPRELPCRPVLATLTGDRQIDAEWRGPGVASVRFALRGGVPNGPIEIGKFDKVSVALDEKFPAGRLDRLRIRLPGGGGVGPAGGPPTRLVALSLTCADDPRHTTVEWDWRGLATPAISYVPEEDSPGPGAMDPNGDPAVNAWLLVIEIGSLFERGCVHGCSTQVGEAAVALQRMKDGFLRMATRPGGSAKSVTVDLDELRLSYRCQPFLPLIDPRPSCAVELARAGRQLLEYTVDALAGGDKNFEEELLLPDGGGMRARSGTERHFRIWGTALATVL